MKEIHFLLAPDTNSKQHQTKFFIFLTKRIFRFQSYNAVVALETGEMVENTNPPGVMFPIKLEPGQQEKWKKFIVLIFLNLIKNRRK